MTEPKCDKCGAEGVTAAIHRIRGCKPPVKLGGEYGLAKKSPEAVRVHHSGDDESYSRCTNCANMHAAIDLAVEEARKGALEEAARAVHKLSKMPSTYEDAIRALISEEKK